MTTEQLKILVVDDSAMVRGTIRGELEEGGYKVTEAEDGIDALIQVAVISPPDLVTLDIEMPKLDGFETYRKLRQEHYARFFAGKREGQAPVIFVTGNDTVQDRKRGFDLGAADFIAKPFGKGDILAAVDKMLKPESRLQGLVALVVDDSAVARRIVSGTLRREGLSVIEAEDGAQAFEIMCEKMSEVDIVITDLVMPRMDGIELCKKIRDQQDLPHLPVIFLTAMADQAQLLEVFKAGATDYLVKPFLKEELLARLTVQLERIQLNKRHLRAVNELEELERMKDNLSKICSHDLHAPLAGILKSADLLLKKDYLKADDRKDLTAIKACSKKLDGFINDIIDLDRIKIDRTDTNIEPVSVSETALAGVKAVNHVSTLGEEKPDVSMAETHVESGPGALPSLKILLTEDNPVNIKLAEKLLARAGHSVTVAENGALAVAAVREKPFDLVLMDLEMPEMNGIEATNAIRAWEMEAGGHIPIIALSAHNQEETRERCIDAGMDDYITKPIRPVMLADAIKRQMHAPGQPEDKPADKDEPEETDVFDRNELMKRVDGDEDLLNEILSIFMKDIPGKLEVLKQAVEDNDPTGVGQYAHAIKGASANIAAHRLKNVAAEMEKAGMAGNLEPGRALQHKIETEFAKLQMTLNEV
ncbi:MAG: response regulator [Thermodesulfobacteriota bacterium]|nr:response regulator [Thermodesulfobacteriota bacterium]